jgi:HK97 family phage major capsid protein
MDELLKILKTLLPGHNDKVYKGIVAMLGVEGKFVATGDEGNENSVTIQQIAKSLLDLGYKVQLPGLETDRHTTKNTPFAYEQEPVTPARSENEEEDKKNPAMKAMGAFYASRFGDRKEAMKSVLSDLIGTDYQQTIYEQNVAFAKYIRGGERAVDSKEMKLLNRQFFPEDAVTKAILDEGFDVATIKATQVEAQGELGGIAVPPNRQSDITARLPGLTAVRGGGATVITLVNSNSTEIPQWRGDNQRYIGMLRGQWGGETAQPTEQNFKLDMVPVVANIYTYKVPLSQSLVEDAANLVTMLMNDIAVTRAIDEDQAFLVGDGIGKPHGILPGGANVNGLKEVNSGAASALTVAGIKALKRGVASQYRRNCVWVANSDTFGVIEKFTAGAGTSNWAFPDLSEEDRLLGRALYESEAMPEIAANAYPLLFGWMMGYDIVERLGMTIQRFQDSNTGPNKVEYHVRARVGGRLERPWMFAVQKVAA